MARALPGLALVVLLARGGTACDSSHGGHSGESKNSEGGQRGLVETVSAMVSDQGADGVATVTVTDAFTTAIVLKGDQWVTLQTSGDGAVKTNDTAGRSTMGMLKAVKPADLDLKGLEERRKQDAPKDCESGPVGSSTALSSGAVLQEVGCKTSGLETVTAQFLDGKKLPELKLMSAEGLAAVVAEAATLLPDKKAGRISLGATQTPATASVAGVKTGSDGCSLQYSRRASLSGDDRALVTALACSSVADARPIALDGLDAVKLKSAADAAVKQVGGWDRVKVLELVQNDKGAAVQIPTGAGKPVVVQIG